MLLKYYYDIIQWEHFNSENNVILFISVDLFYNEPLIF